MTDAFAKKLLERGKLERAVVEAAKEWRATPPVSDGSTSSWVRAHRALERAIDDLVQWETA